MRTKLIILFILNFLSIDSFAAWPVPWQINLQEAATPVMEKFHEFHNMLLIMCYGISIFVMLLLAYVCFRYSKKNNPIPSKTSHNVALEIVWTLIPVFIIISMAIPSFKLLYYIDKSADTELTLKVIGRQWYWQYEYPDNGNIAFDSYMIADTEIKEGQFRLLEVDNRVVLPVDTNIKILTTAGDVIHSWAVPAFGIKIDCIPGRTNETWMRATKLGTYYGQCSELCGVNHGFMPIAVEIVTKEAFKEWVEKAKIKFAKTNTNLSLAYLNR